MSNTPRTDQAEKDSRDYYDRHREPGDPVFCTDAFLIARTLERELNEAYADNERLKGEFGHHKRSFFRLLEALEIQLDEIGTPNSRSGAVQDRINALYQRAEKAEYLAHELLCRFTGPLSGQNISHPFVAFASAIELDIWRKSIASNEEAK